MLFVLGAQTPVCVLICENLCNLWLKKNCLIAEGEVLNFYICSKLYSKQSRFGNFLQLIYGKINFLQGIGMGKRKTDGFAIRVAF